MRGSRELLGAEGRCLATEERFLEDEERRLDLNLDLDAPDPDPLDLELDEVRRRLKSFFL